MRPAILSREQLRQWLQLHQKRLAYGDEVTSMTDIAKLACISRQTLYKVIEDDRSQFGQAVQTRLSLVVGRIAAEPRYQHSKVSRIDLSGGTPRIRFGL